MLKLAVMIVGGAWHTAEYLQPLARNFEEAGYETKTVPLPSAGANPPVKDASGDVAAIRDVAESYINPGKNVLAILHSMSAISGTEALHGMGKDASAGGCGVVAMVYIASHVLAKGHDFGQHVAALGNETWAQARAAFVVDGTLSLPPEMAKFMLYGDLPDDEANYWVSRMVPQSISVYDMPFTHDTYNEKPIGYIACMRDEAYQYSYQLQNIADRGIPENRVLKLDTGHNPWLQKPNEVRDLL